MRGQTFGVELVFKAGDARGKLLLVGHDTFKLGEEDDGVLLLLGVPLSLVPEERREREERETRTGSARGVHGRERKGEEMRTQEWRGRREKEKMSNRAANIS
eukprot:754408-Hanusia_phi.AAC.2